MALSLKSQKFEKLHKINIFNKVIIYNIMEYHDISILFAAASRFYETRKFLLYFALLRAILLDLKEMYYLVYLVLGEGVSNIFFFISFFT